jgi:hypothetical protein
MVDPKRKTRKGKLEFHQNLINVSTSNVNTLETELEKLKPPYDLLVDLDKVSLGRGERTWSR